MNSVLGILLLPTMALATFTNPFSHTSNRSATLSGLDNTNIAERLVHRQIAPQAYGAPCSDEGAWFCMSENFQRCASGEWSTIQQCAPGTQCEPLGLTHNASQPAFGIYNGSGGVGTVTVNVVTSTMVAEPVTMTTTIDITMTDGGSASSSSIISSASSLATRTSISTTSSSSSMLATPKADTSDGAYVGGITRSTMGMLYLCLTAGIWGWRQVIW